MWSGGKKTKNTSIKFGLFQYHMWLTLASSQYRGSSYLRWSIATSAHSLVRGCSFIKKKTSTCSWMRTGEHVNLPQWPPQCYNGQQWQQQQQHKPSGLVFSNPETAPAEGESPYLWFVLGRNTSTNPVMQCGSRENVISSRKHSNLIYACDMWHL